MYKMYLFAVNPSPTLDNLAGHVRGVLQPSWQYENRKDVFSGEVVVATR